MMVSMDGLSFRGIWVPLVSPFHQGAVDHTALQRLVRHQATQGVAGFVACGSTGEAAMLDEAEQDAVLASVLDAAGGLPVLMGVSGVRPERVAARARQLAQRLPTLAGWLLAAPAYVKPSQAGLIRYFHTVADATPLPLVAYDIPARTGVRLEPATLRALAEHPQIRALKDCSGDRATAEHVLADGRLALLGGNDDELFDQLARGAVGAITASAHLATADFVQLYRCLADGRLAEARALWRRLQPLTGACFAEPNPAPIKAALARGGWLHNELRAPMWPASAATTDRVLAALASRLNTD
jgi:4-hydroxy-tetrahydrodipicolinate synthase